MSGMDDFLNLFADPRAVAAMQEKEAQLATAKQLQQLISGNQQPFEAELFPGESPIQGLSTGTPGALPASSSRDFINQLLGSGSQQFAGQGIGLAQQALGQQGQRDIAANSRQALQAQRQKAVQGMGELPKAQQLMADIFSGGGPSSAEAFKALTKQLDPFTLSQGQKRFTGTGREVARVKKKEPLTPLQKNVAATGLEPGTDEFHQAMKKSLFGAGDTAKAKEFRKAKAKFGNVGRSLDTYSKLLNKTGAVILPGVKQAKLRTSYRDLLLELKELFNLGVLNGPDLEIMEQVIIDPTTLAAQGLEAVSGKKAFQAQIELLRNKLDAAKLESRELFGPSDGSGKPPKKNAQKEISDMTDEELRAEISRGQ